MEKPTRNPFEMNILLVACAAGFFRTVLAVIGDLEDLDANPDFITDALFVLVFGFGIVAVLVKMAFRWILFFFYIPITLLFIYSFYASYGLLQEVEHNVLAGLIIINFTLRDRWPLYFTIGYIIGIVITLFILNEQLESFENVHPTDLSFIFVSLGIIGVTYYAKHIFANRRLTLKMNQQSLEKKSRLLRKNQASLYEQKKALEELAVVLDQKVSQKTKALTNQMKRRERYLSLTSDELQVSADRTMKLIDDFKLKHGNEPLIEMLAESGEKLKHQIENLNHKFDGEH